MIEKFKCDFLLLLFWLINFYWMNGDGGVFLVKEDICFNTKEYVIMMSKGEKLCDNDKLLYWWKTLFPFGDKFNETVKCS